MTLSRKAFIGALSVAIGGLLLSGAPSDAQADGQAARAGYRWETHRGSNIKFELPNAWTTSTDGDVLVTKPTQPGLGIEFVGIAHGSAEAKKAEEALLQAVVKRIPDAHTTGPSKPVAQNGLTGVVVQGEGTKNGRKVEWFSVVLGDGKGHGLLSLGFAAKGQIATHRPQIIEIFNSIRPAS